MGAVFSDLGGGLDKATFGQFIATILDQRRHTHWRGLNMKLQSNDAFPICKRLVYAANAGRQPVCTRGQIKRVTMPVKHSQFARHAWEEKFRAGSRSQGDGQPADFFLRVLINLGSENLG